MKIYKSNVVLDNVGVMTSILDDVTYEGDLTMSYDRYNIFGLTSPTQVFYDLFNELRGFVYDYTDADQLWMQAWLNRHMPEDVLPWHDHAWPIHGYIGIRPFNTTTVFEDFEIQNEVGNVYIGPGYMKHKVVVNEPFTTPRLTIGFDILHEPGRYSANLGLIPFPK